MPVLLVNFGMLAGDLGVAELNRVAGDASDLRRLYTVLVSRSSLLWGLAR